MGRFSSSLRQDQGLLGGLLGQQGEAGLQYGLEQIPYPKLLSAGISLTRGFGKVRGWLVTQSALHHIWGQSHIQTPNISTLLC